MTEVTDDTMTEVTADTMTVSIGTTTTTMVMMIDLFYKALFSALEQTQRGAIAIVADLQCHLGQLTSIV